MPFLGQRKSREHPFVAEGLRHGRDLRLVKHEASSIKPDDLLAFITCRNEFVRLPYFLQYYRERGVDRFFFVDNDSNDDTAEYLAAQTDCSVWHTAASYKDSCFGVHWLNYLLSTYGTRHWCLTLDPDEFLVIPYQDTRDLKDLTYYLDAEGKENLFTIMLDMYPQGSIEQAAYAPGQDPLSVAPWFDPTGYYQQKSDFYGDWWIRGGVRRRVFFSDQVQEAPAQNKTVLVKWKRHFCYLNSTHTLAPVRLNNPHFDQMLAPTGCLLHFKYLSLFKEKVAEEMQRRQHYANSAEYARYQEGFARGQILWCEASASYVDWRQLLDLGLLHTGRWF